MRDFLILLATVVILAPVFRLCFRVLYTIIVIACIVFETRRKYLEKRRKLNRVIEKLENRLKKDLLKLVRLGHDIFPRHVLETQNQISTINFDDWVEMEYQVASSNVWRIGLFHSFHAPPAEIERLEVTREIREILWWQIIRDLPQTRNPAKLLERSFTRMTTKERIGGILGEPHHSHLWHDLDTMIQDEFPGIFAKLKLYEKLRKEKLNE